ncbi:hypothetical protein ACP70R_007425 [Stipagrostis hirtigluma subsp. patula]
MVHQMEAGEQRPRASVPAFGGWEDMAAAAAAGGAGALPDYSLDFSKIRAARMQRRKVLSWPGVPGAAGDGGVGEEEQPRSSPADKVDGEGERRRHRRHHSDATEVRQPLRPGVAAPKSAGKEQVQGLLVWLHGSSVVTNSEVARH